MTSELDGLFGNGYLDQFDATILDPVVANVFREMGVYNQLLLREPVTDREVHEIIYELDSKWGGLLNEPVKVTGSAQFPNDTDHEYVTGRYDDDDMIFRGVVAVPVYDREDDDVAYDYERRYYKLVVGLTREGIKGDGTLVSLDGIAEPDYILIEGGGIMSAERARLLLEYYAPEAIDDIDESLLNPGLEECELCMRLNGIAVSPQNVLNGEPQAEVALNTALNRYVDALIELDSEVPYHLLASGVGWYDVGGDGQFVAAQVSLQCLVKVARIVWGTAPGKDDESLYPQLDVTVIGPDVGSTTDHLLVPIADIQQFRSLRYQEYVGYPE